MFFLSNIYRGGCVPQVSHAIKELERLAEDRGAYQTKKEASCMTIAKYQKRADDAAQKMVDCQVS
jgi:hypothetical protein